MKARVRVQSAVTRGASFTQPKRHNWRLVRHVPGRAVDRGEYARLVGTWRSRGVRFVVFQVLKKKAKRAKR